MMHKIPVQEIEKELQLILNRHCRALFTGDFAQAEQELRIYAHYFKTYTAADLDQAEINIPLSPDTVTLSKIK